MADTHINAYFGDVDDKQKLADAANAELEAAKARLKAKKTEVGYVEPVEEGQETKAEPVEAKKPTQVFGRK